MLEILRREAGLAFAENEPYVIEETHYTIRRYAEGQAMPYLQIEIRQDLVESVAGQTEWAGRISAALERAERDLRVVPG
jgi:predicted N-formylglutamate amidohydrolase